MTALNINLAPGSLTTWQLNSDWNNVSGIIFPPFWVDCVSIPSTVWCHRSPRALLVPLNLSTLSPSVPPDWQRDDCEAFKDTQPKVCRGWPLGAVLCVPYLFLHLILWVQPVHLSCHMQHLAEICLSLAVDAKPGSPSELKVAASCSLIWPGWLTARLHGWLTDCIWGLWWFGSWLTSLITHVYVLFPLLQQLRTSTTKPFGNGREAVFFFFVLNAKFIKELVYLNYTAYFLITTGAIYPWTFGSS